MFTFSETIETVSLTGYKKLNTDKYLFNNTDIDLYAKREDKYHHQSFYKWIYEKTRKTPGAKTVIPHFVSPNSSPVWPTTEIYASYFLYIYKPCSGDFGKKLEDKSAIKEYKKFLKTEDCPELVKIADQHALTAYTSNNKARHQPTAENDFPDIDTNHPDIDDHTREACAGFGTLTPVLVVTVPKATTTLA